MNSAPTAHLRPYQIDVRRKIFRQIKNGKKKIVVCMPTGAGKTRLAAQLIKDAVSKGKKALFVVHLRTLVNQAAKTFIDQDLNVGIMQAENTSYDEDLDDVIVASVSTLARRRAPESASIVIIDECHILYKKHIELMQKWNNLIFIGLSATPLRKDLGKYFERLVNGPSVKELTELGALTPVIAYHPKAEEIAKVRGSLKKISSTGGGLDYSSSEMENKMSTAKVVGDIVATWKRLASDRPTIVFAITKANSRYICQMFAEEGISAAYIEDKTPAKERAELLEGFEQGKIRVLCSVGVLSIGFDAPWTQCVILARCTTSEGYHMQQVGRGLRAHPGKKDCMILDFTGNLVEHGMPEEFSVEELTAVDNEKSKRKKKKKKLVACKECGFVFEAVTRSCEKCGTDRFGGAVHLEVIEGDLVLAGTESMPWIKSKQDLRKEYLGLLWYAREHNYKDGWAFIKYMERNAGAKPAWGWRSSATVPPSPDLVRWIKRSQIAWAKRRKA